MAELDWKFYQVFGETNSKEDVTDVDIVSAVEFNEDGNFIAAGDRGGRVVLFKRCRDLKPGANPEYTFYAEFQSHEPEFDYLKSLEIEEKINKIKWCKRQNQSLFLLTTNDKTIKLWKVFEKKVRQVVSVNTGGGASVTGTSAAAAASLPLSVPQLTAPESTIAAAPRRVFSNAHAYHINSISLNSDGETFISSDDLRINLWNLAVSDQSFNIVDIKPANMEELSEVITSAEFHPTQCNIFMYSSSKGTIKLGDMRHSALCDNHAKVFEEAEDPGSKSFFSEIISSISDIKFSSDGRYLLSRDYLTIKLWDLNMERGPVRVIPIHDHLRSKLCDLYENDCIFDKFECAVSPAGDYFLTGSYHNHFHVYDSQGAVDTSIEASKFSKPKRLPALTKSANGAAAAAAAAASPAALAARAKAPKEEINPDMLDFSKKILHVAWHPTEHILAVGANNNLYVYGAINTNADDGASSTTSAS